jgi:glycosyltransferase involved in cell wall biosynthesis
MIVISNGFNKFHLAVAAAEMERRGLLTTFMTGAYPPEWLPNLLHAIGLEGNAKLRRLIARKEAIGAHHIYSDWISEAVNVAGGYLKRMRPFAHAGDFLDRKSLQLYGRRAVRAVRVGSRDGGRIYHYRAGFGHASVNNAKEAGMVALCDHSIAHPGVLESLVDGKGRLPVAREKTKPNDRFWREVLEDIERADAVLVNSDFVKETFLQQGWDGTKLYVIYYGVDDAFLDGIPARRDVGRVVGGNIRVVFAGSFERRKGAEELTAAMRMLNEGGIDLCLDVAGGVGSDSVGLLKQLQRNPRVRYHGLLSRRELAKLLFSADIFVFPSLAEGSARVVFEALACGCYVITTPNSGSIVEDGVHGRLVPPGDAAALAKAITQAISLGREMLSKVGARNASVIREQYSQSQYGDKLARLYWHLLEQNAPHKQRQQNVLGGSPIGREHATPKS